jgi:peptidoglycan hydrolase CwlO-like protein
MFEDEQVVAAGLRHDLKRTEAITAQLNTRLTTLNSGAKDQQVKLAAAAATEATSMVKWDAERQQLQDERRGKLDRDEAKEALRRARAEDDDNKQWMIRRARDSKDPGTVRTWT